MESDSGEQRDNALAIPPRANATRQGEIRRFRLRQTQIVDVGAARLECTVSGSGDPLVVLANAGCSTGYLESCGERIPGVQNLLALARSRG